jgi:hypothetical protein
MYIYSPLKHMALEPSLSSQRTIRPASARRWTNDAWPDPHNGNGVGPMLETVVGRPLLQCSPTASRRPSLMPKKPFDVVSEGCWIETQYGPTLHSFLVQRYAEHLPHGSSCQSYVLEAPCRSSDLGRLVRRPRCSTVRRLTNPSFHF